MLCRLDKRFRNIWDRICACCILKGVQASKAVFVCYVVGNVMKEASELGYGREAFAMMCCNRCS